MEFVASVVRSLAWPMALVVVGVLFRTQIRGLVRRLESATYKEGTLSFAREVEALSVHIAQGELAVAPVTDVPAEADRLKRTTESPERLEEERRRLRSAEVAAWRPPRSAERLAEALADSPSAAVIASWQALEDGLTALATAHGAVPQGASFLSAVEALVEAGGIDKTDEETLRTLQRLRVAAGPGTNGGPNASTAISYGKVIDKILHTVSTQLQSAAERFEGAALPPKP